MIIRQLATGGAAVLFFFPLFFFFCLSRQTGVNQSQPREALGALPGEDELTGSLRLRRRQPLA